MRKLLVLLLVLLIPLQAHADEPQLKKMSLTCYVMNTNLTYSGTECRAGVCAVDKEHIGQMAIVYLIDDDGGVGECIGTYSCEDLIGTEAGRNGYVIDLWRSNLTQATNTMKLTKGKCYVQFVEGNG